MTDDNELERRQFMQKPTPAKPKIAGAPSPMFEKFVPPAGTMARAEQDYTDNKEIALTNAFTALTVIVNSLRRFPKPIQKQMIELISETLLD